MKGLIHRLHARLGDFWWYSLMIFMAARAADCLNVFVGLWLVPKYVPPSELGAVMPLANFASFLAVPIAVFASTFRQELTRLSVTQQFGKLKTLIRGVFIAAAVFLFVAIVVSHFLLPHFLLRIRIAEGSLGMLVIVYSFISALAPVFNNPLQALKKFKATTVINLIGAPVRLLSMLVTMPFRALSGYFVGQTSVPAFSIVTSVIALRKELSVKAEPYWTRNNIRQFSKLFLIFLVCAIVGYTAGLVEATIIRQRLPEVDSAAYYIVTRFSDISCFLATTLSFTIFPFVAELASKGKSTTVFGLKTILAVMTTNAALAVFFYIFGEKILLLIPNGKLYVGYSWAIPTIIGVMTFWWIASLYTTIETAASRFGYMKWWIPMNLIYSLVLLFVTGIGYFANVLPPRLYALIASYRIESLKAMLILLLWWNIFKVVCCAVATIRMERRRKYGNN